MKSDSLNEMVTSYYRWRNKIIAEQNKFRRRTAVVLFIVGMGAVITVIIGLVGG